MTNLTGPSVAESLAFDVPTNDTYVFNWTSALTDASVFYDAMVDNGTAQLTIVDGDGTTLLDTVLSASINETQEFDAVAAGNWTLTVTFDAFVGSLDFTVDALPQETTTTSTSSTASTTASTTSTTSTAPRTTSSTTTAATDDDDSSGIPGPGLVLLVAALGAAAVLLRRR